MRTPVLALLFGATLISGNLPAQEREPVTVKSGSKNAPIEEDYYVLTGDKTVKDGPYQYLYHGQLIIKGYYDHGQKDSVWETHNTKVSVIAKRIYTKGQRTGEWIFYDSKSDTAWSYDFASNRFSIRHDATPFPDTTACYYLSDSGSWLHYNLEKPLLPLVGINEWFYFLNRTLRYPDDAVDKEQMGEVIVSINVNEQGLVTDYAIAQKTPYPSLNAEALRTVKLFPFEFVPAEKNGVKIKSQFRVPIRFKLEAQ